MKSKARELSSPPGHEVWWIIQQNTGGACLPPLHMKGKTAFEAAQKLGLTLSQCGQISWQEEEPLAVGWA